LAAEAVYEKADAVHPAGYRLRGVTQPTPLAEMPSASLDSEPILLSPSDNAWLDPDECFVVSDLSFEQLLGNQTFRRYLSTSELIAGLHNRSLDYGGDVKVLVHHRFLSPLIDFSMFLLGLPLVLGRKTRSIYVNGALGVGIVAAVFVVTVGSHSAASQYLLRPVIAAWLPLVVFAPLAFVLVRPLWD
jgi:lipopolysaccharide export system permease protein